jgi:hypothetical protein
VFVRQNLPTEHQQIQAGHAIYGLAFNYRPDVECPNHIHIGVPDVAALKRVLAKLEKNRVPHFAWHEPDFNLGFTAVATAPLHGDARQTLANYRCLKHSPVAQSAERQPLKLEMLVRSQPGEPDLKGGSHVEGINSQGETTVGA